jgi:hypothetical protein
MSKHIVKSKMGAKVLYCGHDATFAADIYVHGDAALVVANGPIEECLERPARGATHHLVDYPLAVYWSPRRGVFMVPAAQVLVL